jgi:hypothetical protein
MKIYVVLKCAINQHGTLSKGATEAAFSDPEKAKAFLKDKPVIWEETSDQMLWYCERGVHETELD